MTSRHVRIYATVLTLVACLNNAISQPAQAWGTGWNVYGQLGSGNGTILVIPPTQLANDVVALSAGAFNSLFIKSDSSLWGMGRNENGELGIGHTSRQPVPVQISTNVSTVSSGGGITAFIKKDATLWVMGYNSNAGSLGDGTATNRASPVQIASDVTSVSVGPGIGPIAFTKKDGSLWRTAVLENGVEHRIPTLIVPGDVAEVAMGANHMMFIKHDSTLWGIGDNSYGQLGDGTTNTRPDPVQVNTSVTSVSTHRDTTLFIKQDGTLWGMGRNSWGELGDGTMSQRVTPVRVANDVARASLGFTFSVYLKKDGTLWGVGGDGRGDRYGVQRFDSKLTPIQIFTGVANVSAGEDHIIFLSGTPVSPRIPPAVKIAQPITLPPVPTTAPPTSALPSPETLSSSFTTFYAANKTYYDIETQSFLDSQIIRLGQWLNSHKSKTVSNVFLIAADAIDIASRAVSLALSFVDLKKLSTGGAKALGSEAEQLRTVLSYSLSTSNELGVLADTPAKVLSVASATSDAVEAAFLGGGAPALLSLNATIWGDFVVPQLRTYGRDPPDPNYTVAVTLERVVFNKLPTTGDATLDALLATELQSAYDMGMYIRAANQTLDKYGGALLAGDSKHALSQMALFVAFMSVYEQTSRQAGADARALSDYLTSKGFVASSQDVTLLSSVQQDVRSNGFSSGVMNYLTAAGYSSAQVAQLRTSFLAYTPPAIAPDVSFLTKTAAAASYLTSAQSTAQLANLSVRTTAGTNENTLIAGFALSGASTKSLLIRGVGPSLSAFGVGGALASPRLDIYLGATVLQSNAGWESTLTPKFTSLGAFALPNGSKDASLIASLASGSYTAHIAAQDASQGVALIEIYDDYTVPSTSRLVNISARSRVTSGEGILIAGFVINGNSTKQLLIRAIGPTLGTFFVPDTLGDPQLKIYTGTTLVAENDDWSRSPNAVGIATSAQAVGAFALGTGTKDSALLVNLPPGSYTAQISGVGGQTGVALVEIYDVP